jgi:hypothetical protein
LRRAQIGVGDRDLAARPGEGSGDRGADAARASGHKRAPSRNIEDPTHTT